MSLRVGFWIVCIRFSRFVIPGIDALCELLHACFSHRSSAYSSYLVMYIDHTLYMLMAS